MRPRCVLLGGRSRRVLAHSISPAVSVAASVASGPRRAGDRARRSAGGSGSCARAPQGVCGPGRARGAAAGRARSSGRVPAVTEPSTPRRRNRVVSSPGRLAREGDREHVVGIVVALTGAPRDPTREHARLARAGTRVDGERQASTVTAWRWSSSRSARRSPAQAARSGSSTAALGQRTDRV